MADGLWHWNTLPLWIVSAMVSRCGPERRISVADTQLYASASCKGEEPKGQFYMFSKCGTIFRMPSIPMTDPCMLYMVSFTINISPMLAYIYIYHTWIRHGIGYSKRLFFSAVCSAIWWSPHRLTVTWKTKGGLAEGKPRILVKVWVKSG